MLSRLLPILLPLALAVIFWLTVLFSHGETTLDYGTVSPADDELLWLSMP